MDAHESEVAELQAQLARLSARVYALEAKLAPALPRPVAPAPPPPRPAPEPVLPATLAAATRSDTLESRIGVRWFSYLGLLALVLGLAILLKLAIDNDWIGLSERVAAGVVLGLVFFGGSERLLRRGFTYPAYAMNAAGAAAIYLALWAGALLYGLFPVWLAFAGMAAVSAYEGWCSWAKDDQAYATLGMLGGFLIPVVLANGQLHEAALFSFLLVLDACIAFVGARKPWPWMLPCALVASLLLGEGWQVAHYGPGAWIETCLFAAAFIVLFTIAVRAAHGMRAPHAAADELHAVVLPVAITGFGMIALIGIALAGDLAMYAGWRTAAAAIFAAFCFGLFRYPASAERPSQERWQTTQFLLAIALTTVAVALEWHGRPLVIAWLLEGVAVVGLCRLYSRQRLARAFALGLVALGGLATVVMNPYAGARVLANPRFATFLVAMAIAAAAALITHRAPGEPESGDALGWPWLAGAFALIAIVLPLLAGLSEIHTAWWGMGTTPRPGAGVSVAHWRALEFGSQLSYSIWAMLYGAALLAAGFWRRWARLRWLALAVLLLAIVKVLLFDASELTPAYRVVSLLVLGALLLGISFAYQRNWLKPLMHRESLAGEAAPLEGAGDQDVG